MIHSYETSFTDFPGKYAMTIFFGGCNLHCPFCYNRKVCDMKKDGLDWLDVIEKANSIDAMFKTRLALVFSGGEPTIAPEFPRLANWGHVNEFPLGLHTNGLVIPKGDNVFESVVLSLKPRGCGTPQDYVKRLEKALHYYSTSPIKELRIVEEESELMDELLVLCSMLPVTAYGYKVNIVNKEEPHET